jgi:hypothetical protein
VPQSMPITLIEASVPQLVLRGTNANALTPHAATRPNVTAS